MKYRWFWTRVGNEWILDFDPQLDLPGRTRVNLVFPPPPPHGPAEFDIEIDIQSLPKRTWHLFWHELFCFGPRMRLHLRMGRCKNLECWSYRSKVWDDPLERQYWL